MKSSIVLLIVLMSLGVAWAEDKQSEGVPAGDCTNISQEGMLSKTSFLKAPKSQDQVPVKAGKGREDRKG